MNNRGNKSSKALFVLPFISKDFLASRDWNSVGVLFVISRGGRKYHLCIVHQIFTVHAEIVGNWASWLLLKIGLCLMKETDFALGMTGRDANSWVFHNRLTVVSGLLFTDKCWLILLVYTAAFVDKARKLLCEHNICGELWKIGKVCGTEWPRWQLVTLTEISGGFPSLGIPRTGAG